MPADDAPCKRCGQIFPYCDDPDPSCLKCADLAAEDIDGPGYTAIDVRLSILHIIHNHLI